MTPKPLFTSRTLLLNGLVAVAALIPSVQTWIQAHPELVLYGLTGANFLLRLVTKQGVSLFPSDE